MWSNKSNLPSILLAVTLGAVLTYLLVSPSSSPSSSSTSSSSSGGCPYARRYAADNAFFLGVAITFPSVEEKSQFMEMFKPLAKYVENYELGTLSYELMESDKEALRIMILERYKDKDYYLNVHRTSKEFLSFREKFQDMINKGTKVDGHSYIESGIGFI